MQNLIRTCVDKFNIKDAIDLEEINNENIDKEIISVENAFDKLAKIQLDDIELHKFLNGVKISRNVENGVYRIYNIKFVGLGIVEKGQLKRDIVISG